MEIFINRDFVVKVVMVVLIAIIGWLALPSLTGTAISIWRMDNLSKAFLALIVVLAIAGYFDNKHKG